MSSEFYGINDACEKMQSREENRYKESLDHAKQDNALAYSVWLRAGV